MAATRLCPTCLLPHHGLSLVGVYEQVEYHLLRNHSIQPEGR